MNPYPLKFSSLKMIKYTQVNKVLKLRTCEVGSFLKFQLEKCIKISMSFCTLTLFWNEQKLMYLKCSFIPPLSRYGSYYVHMLINIDSKFPGMKDHLKLGGISVQAQTKHAIRTPTDQRGEQTINKDAKTTSIVIANDELSKVAY